MRAWPEGWHVVIPRCAWAFVPSLTFFVLFFFAQKHIFVTVLFAFYLFAIRLTVSASFRCSAQSISNQNPFFLFNSNQIVYYNENLRLAKRSIFACIKGESKWMNTTFSTNEKSTQPFSSNQRKESSNPTEVPEYFNKNVHSFRSAFIRTKLLHFYLCSEWTFYCLNA